MNALVTLKCTRINTHHLHTTALKCTHNNTHHLHTTASHESVLQGWSQLFAPFSLRLPVPPPQPALPGRHVIMLAASITTGTGTSDANGGFINRIDISSSGQVSAAPLLSPAISNFQAAGARLSM